MFEVDGYTRRKKTLRIFRFFGFEINLWSSSTLVLASKWFLAMTNYMIDPHLKSRIDCPRELQDSSWNVPLLSSFHHPLLRNPAFKSGYGKIGDMSG